MAFSITRSPPFDMRNAISGATRERPLRVITRGHERDQSRMHERVDATSTYAESRTQRGFMHALNNAADTRRGRVVHGALGHHRRRRRRRCLAYIMFNELTAHE